MKPPHWKMVQPPTVGNDSVAVVLGGISQWRPSGGPNYASKMYAFEM